MNDPTLTKYERERRAVELMRAAIFAWYGETCACCDTAEDLGVDHVDGDGPEQRAAALGQPGRTGYNPAGLYRWIIEHGFPDGFQTMCRPCNSSKGTGDRCRLSHGNRTGQRRERNAAAQAAWRARNGTGRHVSVKPGTAGGKVLAYLSEHGVTPAGELAGALGLTIEKAGSTLSGLVRAGHIRRPKHGVYCLPGQESQAAPQRVYGRGPDWAARHAGRETAGQDWAAGTTWTTQVTGDDYV
jgi:hypothetical protein